MHRLKVVYQIMLGWLLFWGSLNQAFAQPVNTDAAQSQVISLQDAGLPHLKIPLTLVKGFDSR